MTGFKKVIKIVFDESNKRQETEKPVAKKSADLILDIYALQKDNRQIMAHTTQYSKLFPNHQKEFSAIYRKALLHEAVASLDKEKAKKEQKELLGKMVVLSFKDVPEKEQILLLETQIRLARKTRNLSEIVRSGTKLLKYKNLSLKTSHFTYNQLVWAFQTSFNFKQAYRYEKRRLGRERKTKDQLVKLAMLAELGGINPRAYYEEYLAKGYGILEGNRIRAKIVQTSRVPWKEIKDRIGKMRRSPLLLSELTLETFARYKNVKGAELVLDNKNVAAKPAGKTLIRHIEIPRFKRAATNLTNHIISHRSSRMQKDIARRMELLNKVEAFANQAIARNDFPLQIASLTILNREKSRLARDLSTLPSPPGLNKIQGAQYQQMLSQKIKDIVDEAKNIAQTVVDSWKKETYLQNLAETKKTASVYFVGLIQEEAQFLINYAPKNKKSQLELLSKPSLVNSSKLVAARKAAKAKPFKTGRLEDLRDVEAKMANLTHVAYLDQKILELKGQVKP